MSITHKNMKKLFITIFILMLFLFVGCRENTPTENTQIEDTPIITETPIVTPTESPVTPTQEPTVTPEVTPTPTPPVTEEPVTPTPVITELDIPVLTIDNNGVVSWNEVEGATHYNYTINDNEIKSTTSLQA